MQDGMDCTWACERQETGSLGLPWRLLTTGDSCRPRPVFKGPKAEMPFYIIAVVQSLSRVQLFVTPWAAVRQASLSFTISQSFVFKKKKQHYKGL